MIKTIRATDPSMHTYICTYLQTIMILLGTPKLLKEKYCIFLSFHAMSRSYLFSFLFVIYAMVMGYFWGEIKSLVECVVDE